MIKISNCTVKYIVGLRINNRIDKVIVEIKKLWKFVKMDSLSNYNLI